MGEPTRGRLVDDEVHERLDRLDSLLEQLEEIPGPTTQTALDAVALLTEIYGEALARVMASIANMPHAVRSMCDDELLSHLLVLHDLHPDSVERRAAQAVESVQPYITSHGGSIEFIGIENGIAKVALAGSCGSCSSSAATLDLAVKESVLAAAPELSGVEAVETSSSTVIPVESLLRRPVVAGHGSGAGAP